MTEMQTTLVKYFSEFSDDIACQRHKRAWRAWSEWLSSRGETPLDVRLQTVLDHVGVMRRAEASCETGFWFRFHVRSCYDALTRAGVLAENPMRSVVERCRASVRGRRTSSSTGEIG